MSRFDSHFRMETEDAILYAKEKLGMFDEHAKLQAEEIGDGNINYVFKVWDVNTKKSVIIKHADIFLRSSGRELDVDRNRIEAEVLMLQGILAPGLVPKVYKYDSVMCTLSMEDISDHGSLRKELLKRKTFPDFEDHITTFIVDTLLPTTDLVMDSGEKKDNVKKYINKDLCKISEDLVFTEPFIDYKGRNTMLEENMEFVKRQLYEDKELILEAGKLKNNFMNNSQALIHGDLHSGSIFVNEESTKILDPEFAFYGPIGYDLGNVIGNLFFAWANAYVTEDGKEVEEFTIWIEKTIENILELFKEKFIKKYKEIVTDVMAKEEYYMNWYLNSILSDTAGQAGLEIIRRVVGDSKVLEITSITDINKRVKAERILILSAKTFIKNRHKIKTGKRYVEIFNSNMY
ncbi:S-methyl-5-thioribose kinase [Clostridium tetani]|uniref:S-methyl-5-thioribose kinase n=1 Tax=Clostridium tetani TaxID=1513 RepID=A0ABY0ERV8_CLOTA|nr:S-methyl-5-thioribose kinase [Clostridium tetani]CDI49012.1 methylthioribose kinase [Clostridium tetani 12124569]KHO39570.1 5-methylthioribose kinase [Clostridium tetani]RXI38565.1 S-methyl-5-thioribose kinase [Clostridium tetani]RXI55371.1 S-methyl-5-thioribose kinase [Clostridium tetani]RXI68442.1 S-methyl-5-thioribose kinase [Clostridium tetani]